LLFEVPFLNLQIQSVKANLCVERKYSTDVLTVKVEKMS
jgi:hypothetical protein